MSQLVCPECDGLFQSSTAELGEQCGLRCTGDYWCRGVLEEHQCGGPQEACGILGCEECGAGTSEDSSAVASELDWK